MRIRLLTVAAVALTAVPAHAAAQNRTAAIDAAVRALTEGTHRWESTVRDIYERGGLSEADRDALAERVVDIAINAPSEDCHSSRDGSRCLRVRATNTLLDMAHTSGSPKHLIRAYEAVVDNERYPSSGDIMLWNIAKATGDAGLAYIRQVFETAERPPPAAAEVWGSGDGMFPTDVPLPVFAGRGDVLRTPFCRAGAQLFLKDVNLAYGYPVDVTSREYRRLKNRNPDIFFLTSRLGYPQHGGRRERMPPEGSLSEEATGWWNLCWDGRATRVR